MEAMSWQTKPTISGGLQNKNHMLTQDQITAILAANNTPGYTVTFDGQTYTITDPQKNVTSILSENVLASEQGLGEATSLLQTQIGGFAWQLAQLGQFIAANPVVSQPQDQAKQQ